MPSLLGGPPRVVNIGLAGFARDLAANGVPVVQVDWRPPSKFASLLAPRGPAIERANEQALARILAADPWLVGVRRAGELVPALEGERLILHAGPPLAWARMCGPLRGAVCGAIVYEGWAPELAEAEQLAERGGVRFAPNHHHGCVGPMTGITTRSQPLLVVENRSRGNRALCAINEGLGKVMRFGGNDAEVLARLAWLRDGLAPLLDAALRACGGIAPNPDIGDSAILETAGLGAFAMAAAPAVAGFVGAGGFSEALAYSRAMSELTVARNARWPIPALEFAGTPTGIDIRRVVDIGVTPAINTGIAHRRAGVGQVGAGVARAPLSCFEQALAAFADAR